MTMKYLFFFSLLFFSLYSRGQDSDRKIDRITPFIQAFANFSENIPHEKVYLHFDNTSYYQSDHIWFKCYIVISGKHELSRLSKTLYVELLNPGGEIIDKRILKIENGQCHGDFMLNHLPFYSGFYEVRAYTKYMLNFGEDVIFSRLLPVFSKPKEEGNYEKKEMLKYGAYGPAGNYPMKRQQPEKGKDVNLRFFPEGGNLIQGIPCRVAFEATDETGNPIAVAGIVRDDTKQELCRFTTLHEGRGIFTYTPVDDKQKAVAEVEYSGKKYRFDLPAGLPQGVAMEVDNLSHPESIGITLRKNRNTPAGTLGLVVLTGGNLQSYATIDMKDEKNEISFQIDKTQLPAGVSQIVLFNGNGEILCDRLIFTSNNDCLNFKVKTDKQSYKPHDFVEMEFSVTNRAANPVNTTFSLSVRDGANEVEGRNNILTNLLLMSEIKGYIHNPSFYFEEKNDTLETRRTASLLDLLLMVQGWRRYSWKQMTGLGAFEIEYLAEQGIETNGKIVSLVRQIPQPNVDVTLLLQQKEEDKEAMNTFIESFVTDEKGRFSFVSDFPGRWQMILTVTEKGKKKDHRILLDRISTPEPKRYRYADLQVSIAENSAGNIIDEEIPVELEENPESFAIAYPDSLAGITERIHPLPEVTITAETKSNEQDILYHRSTSLVYYDVASEMDNIYDRGKYIGNDIHELLINMNTNFHIIKSLREFLLYKGKRVIFVVNHDPAKRKDDRVYYSEDFDFKAPPENAEEFADYYSEDPRDTYKSIHLNSIKSIYINENLPVIMNFISAPFEFYNPTVSSLHAEAHKFGCVVFIETYPDGRTPNESVNGVRKTWMEGYSPVKEFFSPDYSMLPPEPDYRRTLYWNPAVTTAENGIAKINFYNNSSCTNFSISAETVTSEGMIGIYRDN